MNSEQRIRQLVLRGLLPSEAEQIVQDTDARDGRLLTPGEAGFVVNEANDADRLWVFYTPDIPDEYRRLWTAGTVQDA